jgi:DNA polymerase-3 subunit delta'
MPLTAEDAFAVLKNAHAQDRLAHAYLITGEPGSGKRALVARLCGLMTGDEPAAAMRHADVHTVEPESKSRRIVIAQVRALERELQMRSFTGGRKVGIIFDADRLQPQASNAFLKTLEEPPARTHLLLVSALPDQLLETILSRCIEVPLRAVEKRELSPRQRELAAALSSTAASGNLDLPGVYALVRDFQRLLAAAKEEAAAAGEEELKGEEKRYKQIADAKWFEEREDHFKALGEARYLGERSGLIETLEQWWADILRQQCGAGNLDLPELAPQTRRVAEALSPGDALRRAGALENLRELLGSSGVQEPLAIEVAFLNAFGTPPK